MFVAPYRMIEEARPADYEGLALVAAVFHRARVDALGLADTNPAAHQDALRWFFSSRCERALHAWCELAGWEVTTVRQALWRQLDRDTRACVTKWHGYTGGRP